MIPLRATQLVASFIAASFFTLVALSNVLDYTANFTYIQHVLTMDTTFQNPLLMKRALLHPQLHHLAFGIIIAVQSVSGFLCWAGFFHLLRAFRQPVTIFS